MSAAAAAASAAASKNSTEKQPPTLRKVEFHLARQPESFFSNTSNPNPMLQMLNPNSSNNFTIFPFSNPPSSSFNSRKSEPSDFFEDAVLSFRMPFRRIGPGLVNLGNTCFLNSVIQCLTYTEPLVGYLQSGKHQTSCRVAGFCAFCAIQNHVNRALQSSGRILAPKDLVSNLRRVSRNFRNARQEDAHEYMIHLLESMHKCCLPSGVPSESPGAYEKSVVHRIFGGRLRSQVKCLQCSYCSNTFDPFLDLSLEIVKADSLCNALKHFTSPEQLDGGEKQYKCERCKQKVRALKQLTVSKAPYVLTVHLKRFRSYFSGQKIDKKVQFDSTLNLKPFVTGDYEDDLTYTLYGVLVHAGWSAHSGHYYCFVRTSNGLWYSLDDNMVTQVSERVVMEQKAYMLFYVRDRKKFVSKKVMDIVQKENLVAAMRNVSSSLPGVKHPAAGRNSDEAIQSGTAVKRSANSNPSEVAVQANSSRSSKQDINRSLGNISSESSVMKTDNLSEPKANLDNVMKLSKGAENSGENVASSDSNKTLKSDACLHVEKTASLECPSSVGDKSSGVGEKSSVLIQDKALTDVLLGSTIQGNSQGGPTEISKVTKSRIKKKCLEKSASRQGLLKKISKSRIVGMHLSTKMLYAAALNCRKKKKCKRIKQQTKLALHKNLFNEGVVPANTNSSAAIASTSLGVDNSISREREKDDSKDCEMDTNSSLPLVESNDVLKSIAQSSQALHVIGKLPEEAISLKAQCKDVGGSCSGKQHFQPQNKLSQNTIVTSWETVEAASENVADNVPEIVTIGHVLDEWDEEYDRGKRKKVRGLKNSLGGSNLFQEISSKKAKLEAKKGKHIYVHEPFRI
ncbi:ubiquitin carboxyl-terminal hydrolase 23-like [Silene latifolia]|uniref:ubiquitin carboxyl-terminal hydrolase 23-like n=1 Tax=Silene latifolia TaxID=37657 RepID=UPI003D782A46